MKGLVRTRGGLMIHKAECRHAQTPLAIPWRWAEQQTPERVQASVYAIGLKACRYCKPLAPP